MFHPELVAALAADRRREALASARKGAVARRRRRSLRISFGLLATRVAPAAANEEVLAQR